MYSSGPQRVRVRCTGPHTASLYETQHNTTQRQRGARRRVNERQLVEPNTNSDLFLSSHSQTRPHTTPHRRHLLLARRPPGSAIDDKSSSLQATRNGRGYQRHSMEVALGLGLPAFMKGKQRGDDDDLVGGFCFIDQEKEADDSSASSSIGVDSSSEDEDPGEEDEAQSKGPLGSLDSLEDSLPIKRGLSNFFPGKSKSFQSLAEVAAGRAGDVAKPENPFNKRRRIRMACKKSWSRRASCSSLLPPLPPLTTVEGDDDEDENESFSLLPPLFSGNQNSRDAREGNKSFRSPRSFSLSDLQHV